MTWLLTATGNAFDLEFIAHDSIDIQDIAASLSKMNRFTGHTSRLYSVAEHSLLCAEILERDGGVRDRAVLLAALLHDAHEAYCGDIATPLKQRLDMLTAGAWSREEDRLQRHILHRFGIYGVYADHNHTIKHADLVALATERRDLMPPHAREWPALAGVAPVGWLRLQDRAHMRDTDWRQAFLDRFAALTFQPTNDEP